MTDHHPIDVEQLLADQLATASPVKSMGVVYGLTCDSSTHC